MYNLESKREKFEEIARKAWDAVHVQPIHGDFDIKEELEKRAAELDNQTRDAQVLEFTTAFLRGRNEVLQVLQARATGDWTGVPAASNHRVRARMLEILDSVKEEIVKEYKINRKALHTIYTPALSKEMERRMHVVLHTLKNRLGSDFTQEAVKKTLNDIVTEDVESHIRVV